MTDEQTQPTGDANELDELRTRLDALEADRQDSSAEQASSAGDFFFELQPTGRTHSVGGVETKIEGPDGEPESEWVFGAVVDGVKVPLLTKRWSHVDNTKIRAQRDADRAKSSS